MQVVEIGKTAEGRPQLMAIVTSPENFKKLDRYKEIARSSRSPRALTEEQAHALAKEGKAVVWIDGGLHATEVLGAQQLIETVYQMVSRNDPETLRILNDVHHPRGARESRRHGAGVELVHARDRSAKRRMAGMPRLYQKYTGHDNNRDFYMSNLAETQQHEPRARTGSGSRRSSTTITRPGRPAR